MDTNLILMSLDAGKGAAGLMTPASITALVVLLLVACGLMLYLVGISGLRDGCRAVARRLGFRWPLWPRRMGG